MHNHTGNSSIQGLTCELLTSILLQDVVSSVNDKLPRHVEAEATLLGQPNQQHRHVLSAHCRAQGIVKGFADQGFGGDASEGT